MRAVGLPIAIFVAVVLVVSGICGRYEMHPLVSSFASFLAAFFILGVLESHDIAPSLTRRERTVRPELGDVAPTREEEHEEEEGEEDDNAVFERVSKKLFAFIEVPAGETEASVVLKTAELGVPRALFKISCVDPPDGSLRGDFVLLHIDTATGPGIVVGLPDGSEIEGHIMCGEATRDFVTDVGDETTFTIKCLGPTDETRAFVVSSGLTRKIKIGERALSGWAVDPVIRTYA